MRNVRLKYPGYTFGWYLNGVINLVHCGEVVLAVLLLVGGAILLVVSRIGGATLLVLAGLLFLVQVISRVRYMRRLNHIRRRRGRVEVWSEGLRAWIPEARIEHFIRRDFHYPDAWRPISLTFPGIEIRLSGVDVPVEQLYPPGLDELRDRMFEYLSRRHPDKAVLESVK